MAEFRVAPPRGKIARKQKQPMVPVSTDDGTLTRKNRAILPVDIKQHI
jgi:hypothetical protein